MLPSSLARIPPQSARAHDDRRRPSVASEGEQGPCDAALVVGQRERLSIKSERARQGGAIAGDVLGVLVQSPIYTTRNLRIDQRCRRTHLPRHRLGLQRVLQSLLPHGDNDDPAAAEEFGRADDRLTRLGRPVKRHDHGLDWLFACGLDACSLSDRTGVSL